MKEQSIMSSVFVSYSHIDSSVADSIVAVLDELGIEYFRDVKDITWGDAITSSIRKGLTDVSTVVVILSPASLKSHWVSYEVGFATARGARLLPFLTHPSIDPPEFISDLSYATDFDQVREYFTNWNPPVLEVSVYKNESALKREFDRLVGMMPELLAEMKEDLSKVENKFVREFVGLGNRRVVFNHGKPRFEYYGDEHQDLQNKIDMIEAVGFIYVVHVGEYSKIYRMTEEFVSLLLAWNGTT